MDMTLEQNAKETWQMMKRMIVLFPSRECKRAAVMMNQRHGYEIVEGTVHLDNYCCLGIKQDINHWWVRDHETGKNCDITAGQFGGYSKQFDFPKIAIWNDGEISIYKEARRGRMPG